MASVDTIESEWMGGGRFFNRSSKAYRRLRGTNAHVARAADLISLIDFKKPVFFSLERLGWLSSGVDWVLLGNLRTRSSSGWGANTHALSELAKQYEILLFASRLIPLRPGNLMPVGAACHIVPWFVEPEPHIYWPEIMISAASRGLCASCGVAHFRTNALLIRYVPPMYE